MSCFDTRGRQSWRARLGGAIARAPQTARGSSPPLEREPKRDLQLTRVAHAQAQEAVEVEERGRAQGVDVVLAVESVEHLDDGYEGRAPPELDGPLQPPVEREILVVLPVPVASAVDVVEHPRRGGDGLGGAGLEARVPLQAPWQLRVGEEVELVADVAVRRPVVLAQVVEVEGAVGEGIALVGVVVEVLGKDVVRLELVAVGEALPDPQGAAAVEALAPAVRHEDVAELRLEGIAAGVGSGVAGGRLYGRHSRPVG